MRLGQAWRIGRVASSVEDQVGGHDDDRGNAQNPGENVLTHGVLLRWRLLQPMDAR
jgi:hypothetical protein